MLDLNTLYIVSGVVLLLSWFISFQVWRENKSVDGAFTNLLLPSLMLLALFSYSLYLYRVIDIKAGIASLIILSCSILSIHCLQRFFAINSIAIKLFNLVTVCCIIMFSWYTYGESNAQNRLLIFNLQRFLEGLMILWIMFTMNTSNHRFSKHIYLCHALIFITVYPIRAYYLMPLGTPELFKHEWFAIGAMVTGIVSPLLYALGMAYLCSERKALHFSALKDKAQQDAELRGLFLSTMSHEIRTPLNGIMGSAQLILNQSPSAKVKPYCEAIINSSESLNLLIGKVLDYARLEQNAETGTEEDIELTPWLENLCLLYRPLAQQKRIDFKLNNNLPKKACYYFDQQSVRQVLINLLGNAIKFTDTGQVTLSVEALSKAPLEHIVRFTVTDSGPGIAASEIEQLKEPYVQSEAGKIKGGTGLGLAISERLLNKMQSELNIESTLDLGSRFSFDIRFSLGELSLVEQTKEKADTLTGLSVLLVEDLPLNQKLAIEFMAMDQHQVTLASSGEEAIKILQQQAFDLVLLDMNLPDFSGQEVVKKLNDIDHINSHTPILAFTASLSPDEVKEYLALGIKDIVGKPIKLEKLRQAIFNSQQQSFSQASQNVEDILFDASAAQSLSASFAQEEFNAIYDEFIMSLRDKLARCETGFEKQTDETIRTLHRLASTALQLGFNRFGLALKQSERDLLNNKLVFDNEYLKQLWQQSLTSYLKYAREQL